MINKNDCLKIGTIKRKFGKNDEFILALCVDFDFFSIANDILLLDINKGDLLPVFPSSYTEKPPSEMKVIFENRPDNDNIDYYLNKNVFIPKILIPKETNILPSQLDLTGWTVSMPSLNKKGKVTDIINNKHQQLLVTEIDNHEVLIPLHEDLITDFDIKNELIFLDVPIDLLNLN